MQSQASAAVQYSGAMPDIDDLMEEWPPEVETLMQTTKCLPDASLVLPKPTKMPNTPTSKA